MSAPDMQAFHDFVLLLENNDFHPETHRFDPKDEQNLLQGRTPRRALVMVYSDNCPACTAVKPTFAKVAQTLHKSDILVMAIPVAGVDHDKALSARLDKIFPGWKGYIPFFAIFDRETGKVVEYKGKRTHDEFVHFARSVGF